MITLSVKESGEFLGEIDEADLRFLVDQLEEEDEGDTDYYIDPVTIAMLKEAGASDRLVGLLERAVSGSQGVDVVWERS